MMDWSIEFESELGFDVVVAGGMGRNMGWDGVGHGTAKRRIDTKIMNPTIEKGKVDAKARKSARG